MKPEPGVTASGTVNVLGTLDTTSLEVKVSGLAANSAHVSHIHLFS